MVNNQDDQLLAKLAKLSRQELRVLQLRCEGLDYTTIAKRLGVSNPAIKQYMSRVYVKLGLDLLPRAERTKSLYQTYCPLLPKLDEKPSKVRALPEGVVEGDVVDVTPEPEIPAGVPEMVDEDEFLPVPWSQAPLVVPDPKKNGKAGGGGRGLILLAVGVVLGICLGGGAVFLGARSYYAAAGPTALPTAALLPPTVVPTDAVIPSSTLELPTQTPFVVTATVPPATLVPTLTPLPTPVILFEDNFDQGLSGSWNIVSGNPVVVNGQLTADQNSWLSIGDSSWTDYRVQFTQHPADCWYYDTSNAIGLRVQDTQNMVAYVWADCESEWDMVQDGAWNMVPNTYLEHGNDGTVVVTITVQGDQFTVDVNGERRGSFFNSDFRQGGIALKVGKDTLIDDLKITAIQ
jgi:DNA-binding CsgD family transcriptional regulator